MRAIAFLLFATGILLAVRVMFFGTREAVGADVFRTRAWPLAFAALLLAAGAATFVQDWRAAGVTPAFLAVAVFVGIVAALSARWMVLRSAASYEANPDPEDDPRYRFQGHIAKVVTSLGAVGSDVSGKVAFVIDGRTLEMAAKWLPGTTATAGDGAVSSEVVIERVDGELAFVEPWALVESRI